VNKLEYNDGTVCSLSVVMGVAAPESCAAGGACARCLGEGKCLPWVYIPSLARNVSTRARVEGGGGGGVGNVFVWGGG